MVHGTLRALGHNMAAHGMRTLPAGPLVNNFTVMLGICSTSHAKNARRRARARAKRAPHVGPVLHDFWYKLPRILADFLANFWATLLFYKSAQGWGRGQINISHFV